MNNDEYIKKAKEIEREFLGLSSRLFELNREYFRLKITKIVIDNEKKKHYVCFAPTKEYMAWWENHKATTTYMTITAKRPIKEKFYGLPSFLAALRNGLFVIFDEEGKIIKI